MTQQVTIKSVVTGRFITLDTPTSDITWNVVMKAGLVTNSVWTVGDDIKANGVSEISIVTSGKTAYLSGDANDPVTIRGETGRKCFAHTDDYLPGIPFEFEFLGHFITGDNYRIHIVGEKKFKLATSALNPDFAYILDENSPAILGNEDTFIIQ